MAELAILIPVLDRPHRVAPLVESIAKNTTVDYHIYWLCTSGLISEEAHIRDVADWDVMSIAFSTPRRHGDYAHKINEAFKRSTEPYLFLGADDLDFRPGWDVTGLRWFRNPNVGVVGTQDLGNRRVIRGEHSTHSFVSRTYVDEFGTIDRPGEVLHEGYAHEFVDDEFIETAKFRGAFKFSQHSVVEHLHPLWGKAETDRVYNGQRQRMRQGRVIYSRRKHKWTSK